MRDAAARRLDVGAPSPRGRGDQAPQSVNNRPVQKPKPWALPHLSSIEDLLEVRPRSDVQSEFKKQFSAKAEDKAQFHDLMKNVYGEGYNKERAEAYRQRAQQGDYGWLPKVRTVDDRTLGGANGAYDAESQTVFINENLDAKTAAETFTEEVGHHLDTKLNRADTQGDEGEMFRRVLGGENMAAAEVSRIRNENDKGTITVDGQKVEVEFWNPFKAIGKAAKSVGKAIGKAAKGVAKGVGSVAKGIGKGVGSFVTGIGEGVGGFAKNLFQGKVKDAFGSLWKGIDKAVLKAPGQMLNGALNGVEDIVTGATHLLDPIGLGKPARAVTSRVLDAGRSLTMGAYNTATGVVRNVVEGAGTFAGGLGKVLTGDFKEGFKDMGMGLLKTFVQTPVDAVLLGAGKAVSAVQTLIGLEPPGRRLTDTELADLKKIYGDSIDWDQVRIKEGSAGLFSLNDRPFVHGNTIYMKDVQDSAILAHEMAHVWQHQNGGSDYMSEALWSQEKGHGYDWQASVPGTPWAQLEPEQQAELIEDAYNAGYFDSGTFTHGGQDLTSYMDAAMRQLRAGEGAP